MATYLDGMEGGKHNSDNTESTPNKKVYHITQTSPAVQCWYFEVEAASEDEALKIVMNGEVDCVDYEVYSEDDDMEYDVTDVTDIEVLNNNIKQK